MGGEKMAFGEEFGKGNEMAEWWLGRGEEKMEEEVKNLGEGEVKDKMRSTVKSIQWEGRIKREQEGW